MWPQAVCYIHPQISDRTKVFLLDFSVAHLSAPLTAAQLSFKSFKCLPPGNIFLIHLPPFVHYWQCWYFASNTPVSYWPGERLSVQDYYLNWHQETAYNALWQLCASGWWHKRKFLDAFMHKLLPLKIILISSIIVISAVADVNSKTLLFFSFLIKEKAHGDYVFMLDYRATHSVIGWGTPHSHLCSSS